MRRAEREALLDKVGDVSKALGWQWKSGAFIVGPRPLRMDDRLIINHDFCDTHLMCMCRCEGAHLDDQQAHC